MIVVVDSSSYHRAVVVADEEPSQRLVLVRDWGNENQGLEDRQWAYVEGWKLPDEFDGGAKVPQRFQSELAANMQRLICS